MICVLCPAGANFGGFDPAVARVLLPGDASSIFSWISPIDCWIADIVFAGAS
jgi:hypothetical protein